MYERILVAVDDSPASERAVEQAAELARRSAAVVRLLHVVDMGLLTVGPELALDVEARVAARRAEGDRLLAAARERSLAAGVEPELRRGETAAPGEGVIDAIGTEVTDWRADLVVLGTHGRRGVERMLLGSVAEGVARRSAVPVLLVPQPAAT
jgi:nucleotide-binding universal stress UspA family protein